ncbi:O-methyltransferase [Salinirubrum litoreum]|uniref:O-methyltransferase n=1 Tax=Salinirubrum litoreum TaxID=1126234 RepID=A0ABD5R9I7_9EURY|nr:class I SAM-dependent methyltransferase [Salinirubrum litoreum]
MTLPDDLARFVRATGPDHDPIQQEMADYADEHGFPTIGPGPGAVLRLLARLTAAESVFEFGSGYGYSASWFARGMDAGEIVLTEFDADELDMGRDFLARGDYAPDFAFVHGDAVAAVDDYDGPFDLVLIDHQKERYAEAFGKVREKVRPGGVVVADNVVAGPIDFPALVDYVAEGTGLPEDDDETAGIAHYLDTVRGDDAFETTVLPVGEGIAVSNRIE